MPPAQDPRSTDACAAPTICCSTDGEHLLSCPEARQSDSEGNCKVPHLSVVKGCAIFNRKTDRPRRFEPNPTQMPAAPPGRSQSLPIPISLMTRAYLASCSRVM